jgi:coenzyme F420-reducing hydrogenase delta subunit
MDYKDKDVSFEPEITAFYCVYCGYMAADTAGALHMQYPANVKFVRLPCTGKTDIRYILDAFEQGADGVYQVACPIGNCHHVRGNERGLARIKMAREILDEIGIGGDRLDMFFMSGSQGGAFAIAAHTMTERIRKLGPNPIKTIQDKIPEEHPAPISTGEPGSGYPEEYPGYRGRKNREVR